MRFCRYSSRPVSELGEAGGVGRPDWADVGRDLPSWLVDDAGEGGGVTSEIEWLKPRRSRTNAKSEPVHRCSSVAVPLKLHGKAVALLTRLRDGQTMSELRTSRR